MCVDDDEVCHNLVNRFREIGGETLLATADFYDGYKGRVVLVPEWDGETGSSNAYHIRLGTGVSDTELGVLKAEEGDLLILAVHEAAHMRLGIGDEYGPDGAANFDVLLNIERNAFNELGPLNYKAPLRYLRLKRHGKPVNFYRPPPPIN